MNDIDVMKRAKQYIESLANGIDPLTGKELPDSDIVNNVRISRCLFYTSGILQKVIDNKGEVQREKLPRSQRQEFSLTDEQALALKPDSSALFISKVVNIINAQIDDTAMKKLKSQTVNEWLMQKGLITEVTINGKAHKNPTPAGESIGISLHSYFTSAGLPVKGCIYSPEAQQFIFDNIDEITAFSSGENAASDNNAVLTAVPAPAQPDEQTEYPRRDIPPVQPGASVFAGNPDDDEL